MNTGTGRAISCELTCETGPCSQLSSLQKSVVGEALGNYVTRSAEGPQTFTQVDGDILSHLRMAAPVPVDTSEFVRSAMAARAIVLEGECPGEERFTNSRLGELYNGKDF